MKGVVHSDLAQQTLDRAASALKGGAVTWMPEIVRLLRSLTASSADVSVTDLAELIEKDAGILAKVISAANTLGFNPSGVPVTGVVQAIHVIGYERIRTLAMSLALAENNARAKSPDQQREAVAVALTSGCIAQSMATRRMAIDPGQAFVCASLRNFGRIVMTACMPEEYQAARERVGSQDEDAVFRDTFGLTPLELGRELLKSSDLPKEIADCLQELPPAAFEVLQSTPDARLLALTDLSGRLAQLSLNPVDPTVDFAQACTTLARRYENLLPGAGDDILTLLEDAEERLGELVRNLRLDGVSQRCLNRLRRHCATLAKPEPPPTPPAKAVVATPTKPALSPPANVPQVTTPPMAIVGQGAQPVRQSAPPICFDWEAEHESFARSLEAPDLSLAKFLRLLTARLGTGFGTADCLLFTGPLGQPSFQLAGGQGPLYQALKPDTKVRRDERTVFGICLSKRENVLIQQARETSIRPYLPGWLASAELGAFLLLPFAHDDQIQGVILVGWEKAGHARLDSTQAKALRQLLGAASKRYGKLTQA